MCTRQRKEPGKNRFVDANPATSTQRSGSYCFKTFKTWEEPPKYYVYDAINYAVFAVSPLEHQLLSNDGMSSIPPTHEEFKNVPKAVVDAASGRLQRILGILPDNGFSLELSLGQKSQEALKKHLNQNLYLNVTENCNLQCTYCFFSGNYENMRKHAPENMPWSVARESINRFLAHNHEIADRQRSIVFFGGEPLLCFPFIKRSMDYISLRYKGLDNIRYHVFTNGLLLDDASLCRELVRRNVFLWVSVDGPMHDRNRIDRNNQPTLNRIERRLSRLRGRFPTYYKKNVALIYLQTPPFDVEALYRFFCTFSPAQDVASIDGDLLFGPLYDEAMDSYRRARTMCGWLFIKSNLRPSVERERLWSFTLSRIFFSRKLFKLYYLFSDHATHIDLNQPQPALGLHTPGLQTTVVGVDGAYYPEVECQDKRFVIGSACRGYDINRIHSLLARFEATISAGSDPCCKCWANRVCSLEYKDFCFPPEASSSQISQILAAKKRICQKERDDISTMLSCFQTVFNQSAEREPFEFISRRVQLSNDNLIPGSFLEPDTVGR